jgi:hypothetical protein
LSILQTEAVVRNLLVSAVLLIGLTPCAYGATVTYTFDQAGDGIQLDQSDEAAGGFTFSEGCSNQMDVGGFKTSSKLGKETWAITVPSGSTTGAEAYFLDEKKGTWVLYYADSAYALPWSEINHGTLTKAKPC